MKFSLRQGGFTLIELLITLAILSILGILSFPSVQQLVAKTQTDSIVNTAHSFFQYGRISAINENAIVVACPTINNIDCVRDWSQKWMLFTDTNRNNTVDQHEKLLRVLEHDLSAFQIRPRPANRGNFRWQPLGITHGAPGSITFCHPQIAEANRKITVSMLGRIRLSHDSDSDGRHEDNRGRDLACEG